MKAFIKPVLFLAIVCLFSIGIKAQDEKDNKSEDLIIRKKGDSKEKMTIVIDGDKVTINGKPAEDYKDQNLEIIHGGNIFVPPMAPMSPMAMMSSDFMSEVHSNKAFLGVLTQKVDDGAKITEITKESAAEKAGFKVGDIITKINDDKIADADGLYNAIGKYKPEDKVKITFQRDGKETTSTVALGENKQVRAFAWKRDDNNEGGDFNFDFAPRARSWNGYYGMGNRKPRLGIQVQETEDSNGVKVLDVDEDEPAGKAGLEEDDLITSINGKPVSSVESLKQIVDVAKQGDTMKLDIVRNGKAQLINIKFAKELKTTDL